MDDSPWTEIPNDFLEALCRFRIPAEARQVLDVIIRHTFGYHRLSWQDRGDPQDPQSKTPTIAKMTGLNRQMLYKARRKLIEMNMITVSKKGDGQVLTYSIQSDFKKWGPYPKKETDVSKKGDGDQKPYPKKETDPPETTSNDKGSQGAKESIKESKRNIYSHFSDEIPYQEIIDYLNQRTGRHYRLPNPTRKVIHARWQEGYRLNDFKRVIDIKVEDWIDDQDMSKHLCPDTLFGTKFDKYLNQKPFDNKSKQIKGKNLKQEEQQKEEDGLKEREKRIRQAQQNAGSTPK